MSDGGTHINFSFGCFDQNEVIWVYKVRIFEGSEFKFKGCMEMKIKKGVGMGVLSKSRSKYLSPHLSQSYSNRLS